MNHPTTKNIAVKLYMSVEAYLASKAKCDAAGVSMSAAGNLAFRQWQPAHRSRRSDQRDMPKLAPARRAGFPGVRVGLGGAPRPARF